MLFFRFFFSSGYVCVFKKKKRQGYLYLLSDEESWRLFIDWNRERAKLFCLNVQIMTDPLVLKAVGGQYRSAVVKNLVTEWVRWMQGFILVLKNTFQKSKYFLLVCITDLALPYWVGVEKPSRRSVFCG